MNTSDPRASEHRFAIWLVCDNGSGWISWKKIPWYKGGGTRIVIDKDTPPFIMTEKQAEEFKAIYPPATGSAIICELKPV